MKYKKACSVYVIVVGILMFAMWSFFLANGMVPELDTRPAEIILHLIAEFSTSLALIFAGILSLRSSSHGKWLYPFSIGMLLYTLIVSPGYYIQSGDFMFVVMFAILIVLSMIFLTMFIRNKNED